MPPQHTRLCSKNLLGPTHGRIQGLNKHNSASMPKRHFVSAPSTARQDARQAGDARIRRRVRGPRGAMGATMRAGRDAGQVMTVMTTASLESRDDKGRNIVIGRCRLATAASPSVLTPESGSGVRWD